MPQPFLPFDHPPADPIPAPLYAVRYQPSNQAVEALGRLKEWLTAPRTRKASPLGAEALEALQHALVEGRNGWIMKSEDCLEALAILNGLAEGDDIPHRLAGPDFQDYPRPWIMLVMEIRRICGVEARLPCPPPFGEENVST